MVLTQREASLMKLVACPLPRKKAMAKLRGFYGIPDGRGRHRLYHRNVVILKAQLDVMLKDCSRNAWLFSHACAIVCRLLRDEVLADELKNRGRFFMFACFLAQHTTDLLDYFLAILQEKDILYRVGAAFRVLAAFARSSDNTSEESVELQWKSAKIHMRSIELCDVLADLLSGG